MHKEPATSVSGDIINLQLFPDSETFQVTRSKQQASVFKLLCYLRPRSIQGYFSNGKPHWKSIIWWIKPEWNQLIQKRSGYSQTHRLCANYLCCSRRETMRRARGFFIFILHLQLNWSDSVCILNEWTRYNLNEETRSRTQRRKINRVPRSLSEGFRELRESSPEEALDPQGWVCVVCQIWKLFQVSIWITKKRLRLICTCILHAQVDF